MPDRLDEIFETQLEFNRRFFIDRGEDLSELGMGARVRWTKEFVLHAEDELHELLRETSWKMHRRREGAVVRGNLLEEWVDVVKFVLGLGNVWGFSAEEFFAEFVRKSRVVEYRYAMEVRLRALGAASKVVAVDIDGVLNDYPRCYLDWVRTFRPDLDGACGSLHDLRTAVSPEEYVRIKDLYRESGGKLTQGVRPGARELLNDLRAAGVSVILLSARPYWRISRIYADTLEWLDLSGLRADAVLFDAEKHRRLLRDFPGVLALLEDDPAVAAEVANAGVRVFLLRNELNEGADVPGAVSVADVPAARTALLKLIGGSDE